MSVSKYLSAASAAAIALAMSASAQAGDAGTYHVFPRTSFNSPAHVPPAGDMFYYGGTVFSDVKLVSVMWNKDVVQNTKDQVPLFSAALVDSTYIDKMMEYNTVGVQSVNGVKSQEQEIHRGTYLGQVELKPHNTSKTLTDQDIQKELRAQIIEGALPAKDRNTLYMVYFPQDIVIDLLGSKSCQAFGAYHFASHGKRIARKRNFFYSVEPECGSGFSFLTFAASHEFAEATTDNVPTPGSQPDYPQAWNDTAGFEVGDKCGGSGTLTSDAGHWTVTQFYQNTIHGCSTGSYTSP